MDLTTVIDDEDKLIVGIVSNGINTAVDTYIQKRETKIKEEWETSFSYRIFGSKVDMNAGIYETIYFNEKRVTVDPELSFIVTEAYNILTKAGFRVERNQGIITIDIFDIDSNLEVKSHYAVACDNMISSVDYHTCAFYTRKDDHVKGDLEIHAELPAYFLPVLFGKGKQIIIPTKQNMVVLRNGALYYKHEAHSGFGKKHILSVHLRGLV